MAGKKICDKKGDFIEVPIDNDEPIFTTGVICKLLSVPHHVLKQLDAEGIVTPPRKKGRIRLYSKRELKKIQICWCYMSEKRVNLPALKIILEMEKEKTS
ncbi:MAG TPA: MerR family transcriptional regulator [Candidatus Omnitrophota bacterium]|nr:MerR family transcriptional regulator [Candidatus Omnitrophota bacterium]HPB67601.1 MerR family transcriptional regulator [Candidatus Omnitrophota bacterium]HQO57878.1 MerR family transcriptional regulator [Candidatus Omnitrophota bacterium]HQP11482.1 MerR family transcriptional regulator [Candidatus Omnitrophota bacterium]